MNTHANPEHIYSRELEDVKAAQLCFSFEDQLQKLFPAKT